MGSLALLAACGHSGGGAPGAEAPKKDFTIGWSIYAGWMPWPYAQEAGIVKKWADKYGITIKLVQVNDYVESVNQYTAGKLDGVVATSMDTLTIPAAGGKDTSVVILGDYSDGNDGVVLKNAHSLADIKGRPVNLVELSVSQYLLARGLEKAGMKLSDVKIVNTSDADIVGAFASPQVNAVVTWNPQLSEVKKAPGASLVFDSSQIPNEILDVMAVSSATLKANPALGKALAGIWYETMALMQKNDAAGRAARAQMAHDAGTTPDAYDAQLKTTHLYYGAADAVRLAKSGELVTVTDRVRRFSFARGLFGPSATSVDSIGIGFANGKTLGDAANVKLRFDPTYMQMAADGKL
ncbi:ABC transporter periplasmic binding protein, urea carboxylase region [Novosphingobium nitrogenifigens DSM 19370]|uniref:ABC transporter periplasmic binding protein, urea carboxylase region n=1 Tax=Novosphingobium nitrogenifigens DSM 19370 TaxID=983920 RepID=F1ZCG4_9SPHN|nr:ABC transporter periplasmic binding protein, urea carboxylase region [Novosphingobium nitrogenifigens DSM 19370]